MKNPREPVTPKTVITPELLLEQVTLLKHTALILEKSSKLIATLDGEELESVCEMHNREVEYFFEGVCELEKMYTLAKFEVDDSMFSFIPDDIWDEAAFQNKANNFT